MAVLIKTEVTGVSRGKYDELAAVLIDKLKATPGFIAHYAWEHDNTMAVVEIWESADQHDEWFNNNVRPNLPQEVHPEKHELVNKVTL